MTCRELADFIADYLSDELPADARAHFDQHLSLCPACVAYLKDYEAAVRVGKTVLSQSETEVPDAVPEGLVRAILAARPRTRTPLA